VSHGNVAILRQSSRFCNEEVLDPRFFPLVLNVIDQCMFAVDPDRRITFLNQRAQEVTGYSLDEVIGKPCADVFKTALCHTACPLRQALEKRERVIERQVKLRVKNGRGIPVSVSTAALVTPEGTLLGGVEVFHDLSHIELLQRKVEECNRFEDMISKSPRMQRIFSMLPLVAESDSTVLITGASGTGKELMARAIHQSGPRKDKPFVAVNCAAVPETLLESELFGYMRGAFTDARRDKPGRIAQADGGTLFLDEVGDLSPAIQVKLLRFLQDHVYEPLGATCSTRADVRILAATNHNLEELVQQERFREDLYYRLNVLQISLPPLCERSEDVPLLLRHFLRHFAMATGKPVSEVSPDALAALETYEYPGNIRELENIIERAFVLCTGPRIELDHLPRSVRSRTSARAPGAHPLDPLASAEREAIVDVLARHAGNRTKAARELGIHRSTLLRKIKRYGI
jgi:PAS domain S-box-containing protein